MIDPITQHDWSEPAGPTKNYVPRCHRCWNLKNGEEAAYCSGAPVFPPPSAPRLNNLQTTVNKAVDEIYLRVGSGQKMINEVLREFVLQNCADSQRLDHLEKLFRNCPHVEITFCDDPDQVEAHALGWMIRVSGCQTSEVFAPTFGEVIDKDILASQPTRETSSREG